MMRELPVRNRAVSKGDRQHRRKAHILCSPEALLKGTLVTVCIAARSVAMIIAASDRMLTSGDIQFEPSAGMKLTQLTNSIFAMTSGDSLLQTEIAIRVGAEVYERIHRQPENWWLVSDVADVYVKHYNEVRRKRAENEVLAPLGLDGPSFLSAQRTMSRQLVTQLATELMNYEVPAVSAIFGGCDLTGSHIYTVRDGVATCADSVGFAAIGIGGRHASSQFMFARHAWNSPFPDTLLLTYVAKRRAEVSPGVGRGTDMAVVGPVVGTLTSVAPDIIEKLDAEFRRLIRAESSAFGRAKMEIKSYVEAVTKAAEATGAAAAGKQSASKTSDGEPPAEATAAGAPVASNTPTH